MSNTGRYKSYRRADSVLQEPGLLKAWISLLTDFDTLQEPVLSMTPVIGEAYTIGTAHEWTEDKEAIPVYVFPDTMEAPADSQGTKGSLRLIHTPKIFILGDGPVILEMINNWLNEQLVLFVQDQCSPAKYIQYGCDCTPAAVSKQGFSTGQLKSGQKGYEMTVESFCKFFYNGTISERV